MFHCRENELRKLNRRYEKGQFECIVIYGRRRVGKTALINEFCKDKPVIYMSALNATAEENLRTLSKAICSYENPEMTTAPEFRSYDDALGEISRIAKNQRVVFVIDEYPYLAAADPSISSRLQHLIDHVWSESKLYLILCGSSMSFMEYQVLGYESPLYGRRTAQFKVEPLTYKETAEFNPSLSNEQNALVYGITGGVPHYINKLAVQDDLDEALLENLFDRSSYLFEEPENLLKQELREPAVYNSVITAIAEGASRLNEIATKVGIESGPCSKYVRTLMELGIVRKETPMLEKEGKKTVYLLEDQFFRFWYRFVPQNITAIVSGRIERTYEKSVKSQLSDYMGLVFEKMCQAYLLRYAENLPFELSRIGQWWGSDPATRKQVQIDIVGADSEEKAFIIGSCKFKNEKIGIDEYERLKHDAAVFGKRGTYHYYIFSKGGFTDGLIEKAKEDDVRLVTLDEMYENR